MGRKMTTMTICRSAEMTDEERAAWVTLALVPGIGPTRFQVLLDALQSPIGALRAPLAFLTAIPGVSTALASAIRRADIDAGKRVLAAVEREGGSALFPGDDEFPHPLRDIPSPPMLLFAVGDLGLLRLPAVAVVGSRDHSAYGGEACRLVAGGAAQAGVAVVSGMARGIDALAHTVALDAGGATIGVLGNGFGVIYPAANRVLYERMRSEGLLLTEHPPGERPHAGTFPRRNRLISGLAQVTVVVEAALTSGAVITADAALAQGRDVMALPGPITSRTSVGTNLLLRDGATPLLSVDDLLAFYPGRGGLARKGGPQTLIPSPEPTLPMLAPEDARVFAVLTTLPQLADDLATSLAIPMSDLLARLAMLELEGHVVARPGGRYARATG